MSVIKYLSSPNKSSGRLIMWKKENISYPQKKKKKKGGKKEIALVPVLTFTEQNTMVFASTKTERYHQKFSVCGVTVPARVT